MKIHYLVSGGAVPSWGLSMLYQHVQLLIKHGFNATIIKEEPLEVPGWLQIQVPIISIAEFTNKVRSDDFLIVPEVMMNFQGLKKIKCRKIVFIQAGGYIFESMPAGEDHISLGFEHVFIIMNHLVNIVEKHVKLPYTIIPPFIAPYFFTNDLTRKRSRSILLYPKFHQIDYTIINYILRKYLDKINVSKIKDVFKRENWKIVELKNLTHKEVAVEMQRAMFFVSLNAFEALNTSVVEAMAAGCVVFCYEGFGPRDYLKDGENALAFPNNEAYKLVEKLCDWIENFTQKENEYQLIQQKAFSTAKQFTIAETEKSLINYFKFIK